MTAISFDAFKDDVSVAVFDALSIENGHDAVVIHGDVVIRRDGESLEKLRSLIGVLQDIERAVGSGRGDAVERAAPMLEEVPNPFG